MQRYQILVPSYLADGRAKKVDLQATCDVRGKRHFANLARSSASS